MIRKLSLILLIWTYHLVLFGQTDSLKLQDTTKILIPNASSESKKASSPKYPPKPKHAWELGLHFGHLLIDGDVDQWKPLSGYGLGIHVRRAIHYVFSIRLDATYGRTFGLEPQPYGASLEPEQFYQEPNGTNRAVFNGYNRNAPWFPAYRTEIYSMSLQGILNIGNILFHKERNKWNWYLVVGAGTYHHRTFLDLRDGNGNNYSDLLNRVPFNNIDFNTRQGRSDIRDAIKNIYDGDYETEAFKKRGIFRLADKHNIHFAFTGGMGIARKINKRINIGIEHSFIISDNDYLDGIKYRSDVDQTNNNDVIHYTQLRLAINLGNLNKIKEPLYWLNPIDGIYEDLAELKARPIYDPTDTDGDGVIDLIDLEPNSAMNAPVNTKGVTLDSDKDGLVDHLDAEPFSPPGTNVDEKGVAIVPPKMTEEDVNRLINNKLGNALDKDGNLKTCCPPDWFLPMVHFNLDEYCVKPQYYPQLQHVADVMKTHPDLKIVVKGHTDIRHSDEYNLVLSYNRAKWTIDYIVEKYKLPRERFILMYGGESAPYGSIHSIDRRVEFWVAKEGDKEMERPQGPEAGHCRKKMVRKAAKLKTDTGTEDDKKSGY
ncbi:MAG: OmpA family protein [Saprospiraceae bacterium]|nr:OmpA family protein [Saprospiraceae bacterium]